MSLTAHIEKKLGDFTLNVSLNSDGDAPLGLLGASGSGKSMTLKCLAGIETPDRGHIELDGRVLYDSAGRVNLPPRQRRVGYLFQNYALFPNLTVLENISLAAPKDGRATSAAAQIKAFRLEGLEGRYPSALSGGEQQRVALARLLASAPGALLLDEPLSALDSHLRWQVELELSDVLAAFPSAAVLVSHSRDEIYRLCRDVCVLHGGLSQKTVPVRTLFDAPGTVAACLLSGCKNVSPVRREGDGYFAGDWGVPLRFPAPTPGVTHVGIRAHHLQRATEGGENAVPCTVLRVIDDVFSAVVMLQTPAGGLLRWELSKAELAALGSPKTLLIALPPAALLPLE